jgi:hypothetical protein
MHFSVFLQDETYVLIFHFYRAQIVTRLSPPHLGSLYLFLISLSSIILLISYVLRTLVYLRAVLVGMRHR